MDTAIAGSLLLLGDWRLVLPGDGYNYHFEPDPLPCACINDISFWGLLPQRLASLGWLEYYLDRPMFSHRPSQASSCCSCVMPWTRPSRRGILALVDGPDSRLRRADGQFPPQCCRRHAATDIPAKVRQLHCGTLLHACTQMHGRGRMYTYIHVCVRMTTQIHLHPESRRLPSPAVYLAASMADSRASQHAPKHLTRCVSASASA